MALYSQTRPHPIPVGVDSGATQHMFKGQHAFSDIRVLPEPIAVMTAQKGTTTFATEIGSVTMIMDAGGTQISLLDLLYVPQLGRNLFSVSAMCHSEYTWRFDQKRAYLQPNNDHSVTIASAPRVPPGQDLSAETWVSLPRRRVCSPATSPRLGDLFPRRSATLEPRIDRTGVDALYNILSLPQRRCLKQCVTSFSPLTITVPDSLLSWHHRLGHLCWNVQKGDPTAEDEED